MRQKGPGREFGAFCMRNGIFPPRASRRRIAAVRTASLAVLLVSLVADGSAQQADAPLSPFQRQKAETLLRTQLACLGCHELNGDGGRIAPSLSDVGKRRSAKYIRAMVVDPRAAHPGVPMPQPHLAASVQDLLARYLSAGATGADFPAMTAPPATSSAQATPNGATLYGKWCASCHGAAGSGDGENAKHLPIPPARHADAAAMARRSDDALFDVIAVGGVPYGRSARMPAFGETLTVAEIRALVVQIRTLCNCQGPNWSRPTGAK